MKKIGMIGGMSWESTVTYYQVVNKAIKAKLGGLHSAACILYSVDFQEIEEYQVNGEWEKSAAVLLDAARRLERAGADFIIICTNTMHRVFEQVQAGIAIPILHIADVTADALRENGIDKVGLMGTRYTMEQDFYKERLMKAGIEIIVPDLGGRKLIHQVIFSELCAGIVRPESKISFLRIIDELCEAGARGVILGCTEIGLLVNQRDTKVPLFDTTIIHAERAALYALLKEPVLR